MSQDRPKPSPLEPVPAPGAYLARRRAVAGLNRVQVAQQLAVMPWMLLEANADDVARLADRLFAAERNGKHFSAEQAPLLRDIFPFDVDVYRQLIAIEAAGPDHGLAVPQICVDCACSWHDPCEVDVDGGMDTTTCAWSADPTRCTACAPAQAGALGAMELLS